MKRILSLLLVAMLFTGSAFAASFDLSGLSYEELVALKEQINLAIWNCDEWQEVTVPQGVYVVGEDIPAGTWTIKCAGSQACMISWGDTLDESGEGIAYSERCVMSVIIRNPEDERFEVGDDISEYVCTVRNGDFIVVDTSAHQALFTPYAGKPDLGFKKADAQDVDAVVTAEPTATSTPKPTATSTPKPASAAYKYSADDCFAIAEKHIKNVLKNPSSLQIHEVTYKLKDDTYTFYIDYSAQNGFGGYNRKMYMVDVNAKTGKVTYAFSN